MLLEDQLLQLHCFRFEKDVEKRDVSFLLRLIGFLEIGLELTQREHRTIRVAFQG